MAGIPLCCQQRPVPRTLREQGVPFFVRAPQMETISFGSVGRSLAVPEGPSRGSGDDATFPMFELVACDATWAGIAGVES